MKHGQELTMGVSITKLYILNRAKLYSTIPEPYQTMSELNGTIPEPLVYLKTTDQGIPMVY